MKSSTKEDLTEEDVNTVEYLYFRLRSNLGPKAMSPEEVSKVFMLIQKHGQDAVDALVKHGDDVEIKVDFKPGSQHFFDQLELLAQAKMHRDSRGSVDSILTPELRDVRQTLVMNMLKGSELLTEWLNKLKTKQFDALKGFPELLKWLHSLSTEDIEKLVVLDYDQGEEARVFLDSPKAPSEIKKWLDGHTDREVLALRATPQFYAFFLRVHPRQLSRLIGKQIHESPEVIAWLNTLSPTYRRQIHHSREVSFMTGLLTPDQVAKISKIPPDQLEKIEPTAQFFALMLSLDDDQVSKLGEALADLSPDAQSQRIRDMIQKADNESPPSQRNLSQSLSFHQHEILNKTAEELMEEFKKSMHLSDNERALLNIVGKLNSEEARSLILEIKQAGSVRKYMAPGLGAGKGPGEGKEGDADRLKELEEEKKKREEEEAKKKADEAAAKGGKKGAPPGKGKGVPDIGPETSKGKGKAGKLIGDTSKKAPPPPPITGKGKKGGKGAPAIGKGKGPPGKGGKGKGKEQ